MAIAATVPAQLPTPSFFGDAEAEALRLKASGDYAAAGRAFLALASEQRGDALSAARAGYYATMAGHMFHQTGKWRELTDALDRIRTGDLATRNPSLADRLQQLALGADVARGNLEGVAIRTAALGYIDRWWIIGAFDNERGAGYERAYGPESALEFDRLYDGKKRPVQWRRMPVPAPPAGRIDLDATIRPNDQVLAYCATAVIADRDRDVVVHLGSDEAYKLFVNGTEVAGRDLVRTFAADQDTIGIRLRQGPNLLVLKVCEQQGEWQFAARITDPIGATADGVTWSDDRDTMVAAAAAEPIDGHAGLIEWGGRAALAQAVALAPDSADAVRLAYLLATAHPDDYSARRDRELLRTVLAAHPDEATARNLFGHVLERPDATAEEKDDNPARQAFEMVIATSPQYLQAEVALAQLDLTNLLAVDPAERRLRAVLTQNPRYDDARVLLARLLRHRHLNEVAELELRTAIDQHGSVAPAVHLEFARLCSQRGALAAAIESWRTALAADYQASTVAELARGLLRVGRTDEAVDVLRRCEQVLPFAQATRLQLARLHEESGELDLAIDTLRRWLRIAPEDDDAILALARVHGVAGRGEDQREWLRTALELNPNLKAERRHLEYLETDETPFFHDFELASDDIVAADAGPAPDSERENDPYYYLSRQRVVRAYRNGTTSEYTHFALRILNDEGARRMASFRVPHYWGEQRARILDARVVKPDGQQQRPRLRGASVQFPPLNAGDLVEVRARVDDLGPSYFGDYFGLVHRFAPADGVPCQQSMLTVILEQGRHYEIQSINNAPTATESVDADGNRIVAFAIRDLPRARIEERQPSWQETEPLVRITTYSNWNEFSAWWWNLIRRQVEVSPQMRAKVEELTAGLTDMPEKIAAIYDFVTTDIRYTAWEFGVHGYQPYSTPVIFERRHGDCKDKALLLNALLSVIDVEAYPVLIRAEQLRSQQDLSLPLINHFNHCISYLPAAGDRPAMFLDGTASYHPADTTPEMDQGAAVLVVEAGEGKIQHVPWTTPERNCDASSSVIEVDRSGAAHIQLEQSPVGNCAVALREDLGNEPAKRADNLERRLSHHFGKVTIGAVNCSDVLDSHQPVKLSVEFDAPEFATRQGDGLVLPSTIDTQDLTSLVHGQQREYALLLGVPESESSNLRYRLPAGYNPAQIPPATEIQGPFGSYRLTVAFERNELVIERRQTLTTSRIEPSDYAAFREFITSIDQADRQVIVVRQGEGR